MARTILVCDEFVVTVAVRVRIPRAPDGSSPTPHEAREVVIAGVRDLVWDAPAGCEVTIVDAAPRTSDLRKV